MNINNGDNDMADVTEDTPLLPDDATRENGAGRQAVAVASACLAALSLGLVLGYSSPALPAMKAEGVLTEEEGTWYGSLVTLGAMCGGPLGGILADVLGRKAATMLCGVPFTIGWLLNVVYPEPWVLYIGRSLTGLATGMSSLCVPLYIVEVSASTYRGIFGFCFQLGTTAGILVVYVLGLWLPWRWLSTACALVPALMVITMAVMPETPRWLLRNGRREDAKRSLMWLRAARDERVVDREWVDLDGGLMSCTNVQPFRPYDLLQSAVYKPFLLSLALMAVQQFSGINAIIFYSAEIFKSAGFAENSETPAALLGALQVVVTALSSLGVDRAGRRALLLISGLLMAVSCLTFSLYFYLDNPSLSWISVCSLCVYIAAFSVGWGPLPWLVMSELLPPKGYGFTSGVATASNWGVAFIVTKEFVAMQRTLTSYGTFIFFGGVCVLGAAFVKLLLPETKGRSLNDIALSFEN